MAFNGKTKRTVHGDCIVCGKVLPADTYVYRIEKCKVTRAREPYGAKETYGIAHRQCLLNQLGSSETLLEVLRLANEGNEGHS